MNKEIINKYCRKFGFEIHGTGYMQSIHKGIFKENAFTKQKDILEGNVSCIFDIGANRGDTVRHYRSLFPNAAIYAFEPFPGTFDIMVNNIKGLNKIYPFQKAMGEKNGKSVMYVNNSEDTNSLLPSHITGLSSDKQVANKGQIEVEVCTIDQFCTDNKISQIDILKLDIQGSELAAMKGCEKMLAEKKIKLIYTETFFVQQYLGNPLFHDICGFLHQHDYHIQDLYDPYYGKGSIAWCDTIFLPGA